MKLRTKFNLGLLLVFVMVAAVITAATINYVETNTIREAEHRVRTYMRAAWEIHDSRVASIQSAAEILAHGQTVRDLLKDPDNEQLSIYAGKRGTGLGLYVCRQIMEKHGGQIWAESQEGEWTKFCFTIPK